MHDADLRIPLRHNFSPGILTDLRITANAPQLLYQAVLPSLAPSSESRSLRLSKTFLRTLIALTGVGMQTSRMHAQHIDDHLLRTICAKAIHPPFERFSTAYNPSLGNSKVLMRRVTHVDLVNAIHNLLSILQQSTNFVQILLKLHRILWAIVSAAEFHLIGCRLRFLGL